MEIEVICTRCGEALVAYEVEEGAIEVDPCVTCMDEQYRIGYGDADQDVKTNYGENPDDY